jgi:CHAT domain-containing protein/uncharacterized protein HemY
MKWNKFGYVLSLSFTICLIYPYWQILAFSQPAVYAQTKQDREAEAKRLYELGNQQYDKSQYREALLSYQTALEIYQAIKNRNGEGNSINKLGNAYNSLGQYPKAIDYYQQSLVIFKQISDRKSEGNTLNDLGVTYRNLGQLQKAIEFYQQSIEISEQIGDRKGKGNALNNLGTAYRSLGQYLKAIDLFQQSLAIVKQISDRKGEANALNNLGGAYRSLGQYQKAISFYHQALVIYQQIGDRDNEGSSFNNLGLAYNSLGQYQKAIDFHRQALVIKQQIGNRKGESISLGSLGSTYNNLGQYQKALDLNRQSLAIKQQIGDRNGEGISLSNVGFTYGKLEQYQKAIGFYEQSLAIFNQTGDRNAEGRALGNLGFAHAQLKQYPKAIDYYQQSLVIKKQIGDRYGEGATLKNLGLLFSKLEQAELAIIFYKQFVNVTESIRKDIRELPQGEQSSYLSTIENTYRLLADLLLKQKRVTEALQILDLLKIQELEDYLKNVKGNQQTAQGIRLLEPEVLISRQLSGVSFEQTSQLNLELANKIQQLPKSEINRVPEYFQKLPHGAVLIYPLILSDRLELIIFSANTLPVNRTVTINQTELENLISDFRSDLQDFSSEDVKDSGKKLYEVLIRPIESDLEQASTTTILYAPDGILRYIPLASLYDGKQWLVEKYRVNNLIAYSLFNPNSKPIQNLSIFAGAFGGKSGETRFNQSGLPSTIPEVDNIAATFVNTTKLIEQNFTAQTAKEKSIGRSIVHLATHAEFKTGSPNDSYVLFGDGSKVTLAEINEWQLTGTALVVLSACQTGIGSMGTGAEILGFGYQVQRAGASASIASLWTVSDGGTQLLMNGFYRNLQQGNLSISTALRAAQLNMIRIPTEEGKTNFNHPYFWSAFILIGNGL